MNGEVDMKARLAADDVSMGGMNGEVSRERNRVAQVQHELLS
jgi:hypothetical protein